MSSSKYCRLCPEVTLSMQAGDAAVSVASAASRTIMAESYLPPNPGPYPQDKPPENKVRFTPVQVGTPKLVALIGCVCSDSTMSSTLPLFASAMSHVAVHERHLHHAGGSHQGWHTARPHDGGGATWNRKDRHSCADYARPVPQLSQPADTAHCPLQPGALDVLFSRPPVCADMTDI